MMNLPRKRVECFPVSKKQEGKHTCRRAGDKVFDKKLKSRGGGGMSDPMIGMIGATSCVLHRGSKDKGFPSSIRQGDYSGDFRLYGGL